MFNSLECDKFEEIEDKVALDDIFCLLILTKAGEEDCELLLNC